MYSLRSESPLLQDPGCTRVILALGRMVVQILEVISLELNRRHLCCAFKPILTFVSRQSHVIRGLAPAWTCYLRRIVRNRSRKVSDSTRDHAFLNPPLVQMPGAIATRD